jgi:hypothetical protein
VMVCIIYDCVCKSRSNRLRLLGLDNSTNVSEWHPFS